MHAWTATSVAVHHVKQRIISGDIQKTSRRRKFLCILAVSATSTILSVPNALAKETSTFEHQCPAAATWAKNVHQRERARKSTLEAIKPADPALADQLSQRVAHDQNARNAVFSKAFGSSGKPDPVAVKRMAAVDQSNLAWLKSRVEKNGFPTLQQVGVKGVEDAWLLVQHAERDPAFQAQVLTELKPRLKTESFLRPEYAMLTDRVLLAEHKKQVYGSQFTMKDGHILLRPTEDRAHLSNRRAEMDLPPMADYRCVLRAMYHIPAHLPAGPSSVTSED